MSRHTEKPPLNPEQQAVVDHGTGPLRVIACAGSGKTTALVERVVDLVANRGVSPDDILMITFSVVAKNEMQRRITKRLPQVDGSKIARTFHSIALAICGRELPEFQSHVMDTSSGMYSRALLMALRQVKVDRYKPIETSELRNCKRFASMMKNNLLGGHPSMRRLGYVDPRVMLLAESLATADVTADDLMNIFAAAENIRMSETVSEKDGAPPKRFLTFDDMLCNAAMLLRQQSTRARWSMRWKYVLQDEIQDTSAAQESIATALATGHGNYAVVGDCAQAIFGFRGGSPAYLLEFEEHWPDAKTVTMYRNYRSGIEIVDVANRCMSAMPPDTVLPLQMTSERRTRSFVASHCFADPDEEGRAVAENCVAHRREGLEWKDQAVLVRMNFMTRAVEVALASAAVPYRLVSGTSFFTLDEMRACVGSLRVALDRATADDVEHSLMAMPGIGRTIARNLTRVPADDHCWFDKISGQVALQTARTRQVRTWLDAIAKLRTMISNGRSPYQVLVALDRALGLTDAAKKDKARDEDDNAVRNLDEVLAYAAGFKTCNEMLANVLAVEKHRESGKRDAVTISTIHKAKGAEWSVVYLVSAVNGLMPVGGADLFEERRLFYVAMTRAMNELWISWHSTDSKGAEDNAPSPFIVEAGVSSLDEFEPGRKHNTIKASTQLALI